jgi:hypothetical protein
MKVVCINNGKMDRAMNDYVNLTIGKTYEVIGDRVSRSDDAYRIINDIGKEGSYHNGRFKLLDDVREEKLKQLGI